MPPPLANFGNTCYLNAAMQALLASGLLITSIRKDYVESNVHTTLADFLAQPNSNSLHVFIKTFRHVEPDYDNT